MEYYLLIEDFIIITIEVVLGILEVIISDVIVLKATISSNNLIL